MSAARPHHKSKLIIYIDGLAEKLRATLPEAVNGDEDAIHDARVCTRRLRAALKLFESHVSKRMGGKFAQALKKIRRILGPLRDLDVMSGHLAKLPSTEASSYLLDQIKRERETALSGLDKTNFSKLLGQLGGWWGLREEIKAESMERNLLRATLSTQLQSFCQQANICSNTVKKTRIEMPAVPATSEVLALPADSAGFQPARGNPHELRIEGKALRYTLEMAKESGLPIPAAVARKFKRFQDLLGLWHDFVVLTNKILELIVDQELGYKDATLQTELLALSQSIVRRAEATLLRFNKLWLAEGEAIRSQIKTSIGEIAPIGEAAVAERKNSEKQDASSNDKQPTEIISE